MRLILWLLIIGIADASRSYASDSNGDAVEAFKSFILKEQSGLSSLSSFEMKAAVNVTKIENGATDTYSHKIEVIGKGDNLKEIDSSVTPMGIQKIAGTRTSYLTPTKIVEVDDFTGKVWAKMFTLGAAKNYGLFNCPAFFEDSFLYSSAPDLGVPGTVPSGLASKERWSEMIERARNIDFAGNGDLHFESSDANGSCIVNLVRLSGSNIGYRAKDITFYANVQNKQILSRKIQALDFFHDQNIGDVGKKFRMTLYGRKSSESTPIPIGIFDIAITEIKINCPVDDDSLNFDPASVQAIYDGDHNKWIDVPK